MQVFEHGKLNSTFASLGSDFSEPCKPIGITDPRLLASSPKVREMVGLPAEVFDNPGFLQIFSGNQIVAESRPIAQAYAGHQFGHFNPFLGDGRTVLLGDISNGGLSLELSLKGAGKTPFTFASDGRAGLSECLKEFKLSERLAKLGLPTTRSLCVIQGSELVYRSGFENLAVLTRVAPTFIRFGSFEYCYFKRNKFLLQRLTDFVINHYYPCCKAESKNKPNDYERFLKLVVERTAVLIAKWQKVKFVHGMMNTDNQSIIGITLDHADSQFVENGDEKFVASRSDTKGRYAFGNQPQIGLWNCNVLARSLSPLIDSRALRRALSIYEITYLSLAEEFSVET